MLQHSTTSRQQRTEELHIHQTSTVEIRQQRSVQICEEEEVLIDEVEKVQKKSEVIRQDVQEEFHQDLRTELRTSDGPLRLRKSLTAKADENLIVIGGQVIGEAPEVESRKAIWEEKGSQPEKQSCSKRTSSLIVDSLPMYEPRIIDKQHGRRDASHSGSRKVAGDALPDPKESFIFKSPEVDQQKKKGGFHATSVKNGLEILDDDLSRNGRSGRGHLYQLNSCNKLFNRSSSHFYHFKDYFKGDLKSSMHKHQMMLQEKSLKLEEELHQSQTNFRKQEGAYAKKVALLEQQVAQMKIEMSDHQKREEKQKMIYRKMLFVINQQMLSSNEDQSAFLENLSNLQTVIDEASQVFGNCSMATPGGGTTPGAFAGLAKEVRDREVQCNFPIPMKEKQGQAEVIESLIEQLKDKNDIIEKYESQNKEFIDENLNLHRLNHKIQQALIAAEKERDALGFKVQKLERSLEEQKERESNLKNLHSDEMKYMADINTHEKNLFESRIKELEGISLHLQKQLERVCPSENDLVDQKQNTLARRHFSNPGRPFSMRFSIPAFQSRVSACHQQAPNLSAVLQDGLLLADLSRVDKPEAMSSSLLEKTLNNPEVMKAVSKESVAIQTSEQLNQSMLMDLNDNHVALQDQLKSALESARLQQEQNDNLKSQIRKIISQIGRLEDLQASSAIRRSASMFKQTTDILARENITVKQFSVKLQEADEEAEISNQAKEPIPEADKSEATSETPSDPLNGNSSNATTVNPLRKAPTHYETKQPERANSDNRLDLVYQCPSSAKKNIIPEDLKMAQHQVRSRSRRSRIKQRNRPINGLINLAKYLSQTQKEGAEEESLTPTKDDMKQIIIPYKGSSRQNFSDRKRRMRANLTSRSNSVRPQGVSCRDFLKQLQNSRDGSSNSREDDLPPRSIKSSQNLRMKNGYSSTQHQKIVNTVYQSIEVKKSPASKQGKLKNLDVSKSTYTIHNLDSNAQTSPSKNDLKDSPSQFCLTASNYHRHNKMFGQPKFKASRYEQVEGPSEDEANIESSNPISPVKQEPSRPKINFTKMEDPSLLEQRWQRDRDDNLKRPKLFKKKSINYIEETTRTEHRKESSTTQFQQDQTHQQSLCSELLEKLDQLYKTVALRDQEVLQLKQQLSDIQESYSGLQTKYFDCQNLLKVLLEQNERFERRLQQAQAILTDQDDMNVRVLEYDLNRRMDEDVKQNNFRVIEMTSARKEIYNEAKREAKLLLSGKDNAQESSRYYEQVKVSQFDPSAGCDSNPSTTNPALKVPKIDLRPLNQFSHQDITSKQIRKPAIKGQTIVKNKEMKRVTKQTRHHQSHCVDQSGVSSSVQVKSFKKPVMIKDASIFDKRRISSAVSLSNLNSLAEKTSVNFKKGRPTKDLMKKIEALDSRQTYTLDKLSQLESSRTQRICNFKQAQNGPSEERRAPRLMIDLEDEASKSMESPQDKPFQEPRRLSNDNIQLLSANRVEEANGFQTDHHIVERSLESLALPAGHISDQAKLGSFQVGAGDSPAKSNVPYKKHIVDNKIVVEPDLEQESPPKPNDDPKEKFKHNKSYKRYENIEDQHEDRPETHEKTTSKQRTVKGTLLKLLGVDSNASREQSREPRTSTLVEPKPFLEGSDAPNLVETFQSELRTIQVESRNRDSFEHPSANVLMGQRSLGSRDTYGRKLSSSQNCLHNPQSSIAICKTDFGGQLGDGGSIHNEGDITPEKLREKMSRSIPKLEDSSQIADAAELSSESNFLKQAEASITSLRTINERGETHLRESSRMDVSNKLTEENLPIRTSSPKGFKFGKKTIITVDLEDDLPETDQTKFEDDSLPLVEGDLRADLKENFGTVLDPLNQSISKIIQTEIDQRHQTSQTSEAMNSGNVAHQPQLSTHASDPSAHPANVTEFKKNSINLKVANHKLMPNPNIKTAPLAAGVSKIIQPCVININEDAQQVDYYQTTICSHATSRHQKTSSVEEDHIILEEALANKNLLGSLTNRSMGKTRPTTSMVQIGSSKVQKIVASNKAIIKTETKGIDLGGKAISRNNAHKLGGRSTGGLQSASSLGTGSTQSYPHLLTNKRQFAQQQIISKKPTTSSIGSKQPIAVQVQPKKPVNKSTSKECHMSAGTKNELQSSRLQPGKQVKVLKQQQSQSTQQFSMSAIAKNLQNALQVSMPGSIRGTSPVSVLASIPASLPATIQATTEYISGAKQQQNYSSTRTISPALNRPEVIRSNINLYEKQLMKTEKQSPSGLSQAGPYPIRTLASSSGVSLQRAVMRSKSSKSLKSSRSVDKSRDKSRDRSRDKSREKSREKSKDGKKQMKLRSPNMTSLLSSDITSIKQQANGKLRATIDL